MTTRTVRGLSATLALLLLGAACSGGDETVLEMPVAKPQAVDSAPSVEEPAVTEGDYWSALRVASLEAAKAAYVPPVKKSEAVPASAPAAPAPAPEATPTEEPTTAPTLPPVPQPTYPVTPWPTPTNPAPPAPTVPLPKGPVSFTGAFTPNDVVWSERPSRLVVPKDPPVRPAEGDACRSTRYADLKPGALVVVRAATAEATLFANAELGAGTVVFDPDSPYGEAAYCRFPFTVSEIPVSDGYTVKVASFDPEPVLYSELEAQAWHLELTFKVR